ncbi:hypothetical protein SPRG_14174 [Saprolegnia parasitica CBS 223.65]|uniref:Uncharacterized protein n=1 Tax=Saprolegnia parasitica (strain CBS 223.65) TaxID=695850 RepID=A0A067C0C8_SAPPC|nr:hypothetical protein SPRG_14174 [Saprolegnia parasitica CBS 223.65]KDO20026.1 hypothetical protein SPRG_14174 [Saprolegnia parasitica CBS 223.65]|eukprot:XP_012209260.1 hypothetical protein SPRG_14174 [Saprolegnia parasitica CBS 223.65]
MSTLCVDGVGSFVPPAFGLYLVCGAALFSVLVEFRALSSKAALNWLMLAMGDIRASICTLLYAHYVA